jgi:hypothetical protein
VSNRELARDRMSFFLADRRWRLAIAQLLLAPLILVSGVMVGLELFGYPVERTFRLRSRGDTLGAQAQSDLRLWINGQEAGPAHSLHVEVRKGVSAAFSHWHHLVIFSLPPGVANSAETQVAVNFSLRPRSGLAFFSAAATLALMLWF